jgi:rhodanese-related sulfurtransferase
LVLVAVAVIVSIGYHRTASAGLLVSPVATAGIEDAHRVYALPHLSARELHEAGGSGAVLIDARLAIDFQTAHIAGSLNLPPKLDRESRRRALAGISKEQLMVVFCKNRDCGYSYDVALNLLRDGYTNVRIFRGGWDEWIATFGNSGAGR